MSDLRPFGVLGSIAYDNIFEADSVPVKGERVFGVQLGRHIGGMAANQAAEAARYHPKVRLFGAVGEEESGRIIEANLTSRGVLTAAVQKSGTHFTGQSYMFLTGNKEDYFSVVTPGANLALEPPLIREAVRSIQGGALLLSLEINPEASLAAAKEAKQSGVCLYLCPSPAENCPKAILEMADAVILNRREAAMLLSVYGDSIGILKQKLKDLNSGPALILVTLGAQGALLKRGRSVLYAPAFEVPVLDTVGAGDALTGAFVAALELGLPDDQAMAYGCIAGSLAVSAIGAQSSEHTAEQVFQIYQKFYR